MAASSTYYLDAPTLPGATAVFSNVTLTTLAADGFYSDGLGTVREQVGGVLGISIVCPTCYTPCGTSIDTTGGLLGQGIFDMPFNVPITQGCIIIYIEPFTNDIGIRAAFDSVLYNQMTNATYGYLASNNANNYTYIGDSTLPAPCGTNIGTELNTGGYPVAPATTLNQWDYTGGAFALASTFATVTGTSGDLALTAAAPGYCTLYIPKPLYTSGVVDVSVFGPCAVSDFELQVNCPVMLVGVDASDPSPADCNLAALPHTYYNVPNQGGTLGDPAIHEFFVTDPYGVGKVPAGDYTIEVSGARKEITVSSDGIITAIAACPP